MLINFWGCKYSDYDEPWDGENEERYYFCNHPKGGGMCELDNKFMGDVADCFLLDLNLND